MAKFTPVDYLVGPVGPSMDVDRPAPLPTTGSGTNLTNPITLLLKAAGALVPDAPAQPTGTRTRLPHVEIEHPGPTIPDPNVSAPTGPVPDYGPQGAVPAMPLVPVAPPAPAMPVAPMAAPAANPIAPANLPPINDDLFGRFIRAGMRGTGLPPDQADRAAGVFRLFADKAWRENSLAGTAVSDYESGRGLLAERMGPDGRMFRPTPDQLPPDQRAVYDERRTAYQANRAEKEGQQAALGKLSPIEQGLAVISSIVGSALSPESAAGPGGTMYRTASVGSKILQGAGINAAVVGATDPLAQSAAVERGDKQAYSPAEHAMATGGAALLGGLIPAIGALFRRGGALREAPPVEPPKSPAQSIENRDVPSVKSEAPPARPIEAAPPAQEPMVKVAPGVMVKQEPAKGVEAVQGAVKDSLARMDERMGVKPAEKPPEVAPPPVEKPATQPAIAEAPRAPVQPPKAQEPVVKEVPAAPVKTDVSAVAEAAPKAAQTGERVRVTYQDGTITEATKIGETATQWKLKLDNGGEIKPLKKLVRVDSLAKPEAPTPTTPPPRVPETSPKTVDKIDAPGDKPPVPITRTEPDPALAKSVEDIPEFMRRPIKEKAPEGPAPNDPGKPIHDFYQKINEEDARLAAKAEAMRKAERDPTPDLNPGEKPSLGQSVDEIIRAWKDENKKPQGAYVLNARIIGERDTFFWRGDELWRGIPAQGKNPPTMKPATAADHAMVEDAIAKGQVRIALEHTSGQGPDRPTFTFHEPTGKPLPGEQARVDAYEAKRARILAEPQRAEPAKPAPEAPRIESAPAGSGPQVGDPVLYKEKGSAWRIGEARKIEDGKIVAVHGYTPRGGLGTRVPESVAALPEKWRPQFEKIHSELRSRNWRSPEAARFDIEAAAKPKDSAPKSTEPAHPFTDPDAPKAREPWQMSEMDYARQLHAQEKPRRLAELKEMEADIKAGHFTMVGKLTGRYKTKKAGLEDVARQRAALEHPTDSDLRHFVDNPPVGTKTHYVQVRDAAAAGKPVPPEAMATYRDLQGDFPHLAKPTDAAPKSTEPTHPFTDPDAPKTDLHAGIGTNAIAKAAGPETVGALVGGMVDHWEEHGRLGLTARGMIAGALAVAALRHRIPGLSKSIVGKDSFATAGLKGLGDAAASTKAGRWFHPRMGVEQELWDKLVKLKVETRNFQDDALKIAKLVRENTTPDERILISDWIERRDLERHGINTWTAADEKVKGIAEALVEHVDGLGERLTKVGMLDRASFDALRGEYLHRYYLPKMEQDPGFKQAAARMKASASYALRRGETAEGVAGTGRVGETVTQWTHAQSGEIKYAREAPSAEWIPGKEWKVERVSDDGKLDLHRDYTPQERARMGEIRDANYRFAMGSMEASRDLALGTMFQQIARDTRWASATPRDGWVLVPNTAVGQGSAIKKWGELAGKHVAPEVWDALKIVRKPWSPDELGAMGGIMNGYLKALGMWKVGKTAYNPATHFNNVMGNVSLAALTGEVGPVHLMKAIGALRRKDPVIEEARRAGLSLDREANLGDTFDGVKVDVGLASGLDPRTGWSKFMDWYTNNAIVRAYQAEDSVFKLGAYMRRRAAGESPETAVANVHKVFFDYSDVPLGVQFTRDFYSPFFTYTYKYAQVMAREISERPHRYLAAYGALSALDMMSYDWLYGDRAKAVSDYEREMSPKWLQGRSGFGAPKTIRLPWSEKDPTTGENRGQFLNSRYMIPGGDLLDWVANGNMGPTVWPQVLGNTIFGGNPLLNTALGMAFGKDLFFDKSFYPYPDTNLWDWNKRPAKEVLANWGSAVRFMAMQALPPSLYAAPDKLGQAATGEGVIEKGGPLAEFMGWTGTDFAGRQRSIAKAVASVLGVKVEDVAPDEAKKFKEHELAKEVRDNLANARKLHGNQSTTETRKENAKDSLKDRVDRFGRETRKIRDLQEKAGAR